MNILFTITAYPPSTGGAQLHTHQLAVSLSARHTVNVLSHWNTYRNDWLMGTTLHAPEEDLLYTLDGIPVRRIGIPPAEKERLRKYIHPYYAVLGWSIPGIAKNLERHLYPEAERAEIVHNIRIGREPLSFASLQAAQKRGIPFVFTPLHHPRWSGWLHRHYHAIYRQADAVIALTEAEKKVIVQLGVRPEKVHVTGIGPILAETASGARFRESQGLAPEIPVVLFLGQKYPYKGVAQLLKAAVEVWKNFPDCRFVFIGPSTNYSRRLFEKVQDPRIKVLDVVDLQAKTDALDACTLLCVPSTQESFGGVYTEAWSLKKPVIGCDIPAVAEVVSGGKDGFLCVQESGEIAARVISLLQDPARAAAMGESGYQKVNEHFTWPALARRTEAIYRQLLDGK